MHQAISISPSKPIAPGKEMPLFPLRPRDLFQYSTWGRIPGVSRCWMTVLRSIVSPVQRCCCEQFRGNAAMGRDAGDATRGFPGPQVCRATATNTFIRTLGCGAACLQARRFLARIVCCFSRFQSRSFSAARLSCSCLPLARPSSTLTRLCFQYIAVGTSV